MRNPLHVPRSLLRGLLCLAVSAASFTPGIAQEAAPALSKETIAELDRELNEAKAATSDTRRRIAVRRVIGAAEDLVAAHANDPGRFPALELLFRAQQRLITLDPDPENRQALLETCQQLVKAPDDLAGLRLEADLLLTQASLAKQGAGAEARAQALRPLVDRYLNTPVAAKVLRMAMLMALELGDSRLVTDLEEMIGQRFAGDLEMITFLRDKLGGQVLGAPFTGTFKRSDGKMVRMPMDSLGRSALLLFWSKDNGGEELLRGIAAAALPMKEELRGRLELISFNLDELPDAGESFIRGLGVDWQVLHLPDGKRNPIYQAYVREDPRMLTMSPTGITALIMAGTGRANKVQSDGTPDYGRMLGSALARSWTERPYVMQLASLFAGDFLVFEPEGKLEPARPPELKAFARGQTVPALTRGAENVPGETLQAIQDSFVAPPARYRLTVAEARASYGKAVELCRKAITDHPQAPDLWIVRNRLIVALMGLWKTDGDLGKFAEAVTEAKAALAAGGPPGWDVVARLCLAREALRDPAANAKDVISRLVADHGGDNASGAMLAAAALLSIDAADRSGFEAYRKLLLKDHTEYPAMWTFTAFLLDRHHSYWLFQVPFTAGWTYSRREGYFQTRGDAEAAHRILRAELGAGEGKSLRIPEDLDSSWTAIVFAQPAPWNSKRDDGLPPSPKATLKSLQEFSAKRPAGELKVMLALLGGDVESARAALDDPKNAKNKVNCPVFTVPGGLDNPLVHRLGILAEDREFNTVLVNREGRIAVMLSGLVNQGRSDAGAILNVIAREDELAVSAALDRGDIPAAREKILALAPPFDPNAVDERGRKLPKPTHTLAHLRARARVYLAMKEYQAALADAEEVVQRQLGTDGGMSLRTDELDESEQLRDAIRARMNPKPGE